MKVILTPQGGQRSPYIARLVSSLRAADMEVCLAKDHPFVLWRAVRDYGRPDIIHIQWQHAHFKALNIWRANLRAFLFFLQLLTLRLIGVHFVWTVHNLVNHDKIHARWELSMRRLLARAVNVVMVHCETAVSLVSSTYRIPSERIRVVPHGHFKDYYSPTPSREVARQMLNIPADAPAFLFFGQVRPYKGVENLIEAFSTLQGAQLRLVIAGEPKPQALERSLSAQAKTDSRITTHFGFVPDDQIPVYLNACDLVVLPYLDSLTSGAAVLAMSYGRAVCAPQLGCLKELPPETAILYDSRQPDGLQSALEKALSAPLAEMGRAANAYISQFPWSLTAAPIVSVYQQAVGLKEIPQTPDARLI